jgi:colanic acid/amylovoran biosynthesis glycosyltransferase
LQVPDNSPTIPLVEWFDKFIQINNIKIENINLFNVHFGINFNELKPLFLYTSNPVIVSFHGLDASQYIQKHGKDCYAELFSRACRITTPSFKMKEVLTLNGCDKDKISVHRYGVDLNFFNSNAAKEDLNFYFLSVARLVEKKGLEFSLKAFSIFKDVPNVYYRIIGSGPLKKNLINLCKELGIEDKVIFLGEKDKSDVVHEMQKAHVYVLTSVTAANGDQEGLPVTLIEAHACGLPVISSFHAGIPELVANKNTGFLCQEKSISCISKYMKIFHEHPDIRQNMSLNAKKRVENEFDIKKLNQKLGVMYTTVSSNK